jgi:hypothetical protein
VGRAERTLCNGILGLFAAIAVWRLTGSFWGWLVVFLPATGLVLLGLYRIFDDRDRLPF